MSNILSKKDKIKLIAAAVGASILLVIAGGLIFGSVARLNATDELTEYRTQAQQNLTTLQQANATSNRLLEEKLPQIEGKLEKVSGQLSVLATSTTETSSVAKEAMDEARKAVVAAQQAASAAKVAASAAAGAGKKSAYAASEATKAASSATSAGIKVDQASEAIQEAVSPPPPRVMTRKELNELYGP